MRSAADRENIPDCDVLVVGSGASGLTAAVTAAFFGLKVLVAEKLPVIGGTTARTAGSIWIPGNDIAVKRGIEDSPEKAHAYLREVCGGHFDEGRVNAFLENAPRAIRFLLGRTSLSVFCPKVGSDYHLETANSLAVGRSLYTAPFDGRWLGEYFYKLALPPPTYSFMGISPQLGIDVLHFAHANRSLRSATHVLGLCVRQVVDRTIYGRGTRLTNGAALAGRLLRSALDFEVDVETSTSVSALLCDKRKVVGAVMDTATGSRRVSVRCGVVLASGGFSQNTSLRDNYFSTQMAPHREWSATSLGAVGSGLELARSAGGTVNDSMAEPAAWSPMSLVPTDEYTVQPLPLFGGRASPGIIAVLHNGKRFVDEASPYHDFSIALLHSTHNEPEPCAYLICDSLALRRYGLGWVRPYPIPHWHHLRTGYLSRANTIEELATKLRIDVPGLTATVATVNRDARNGMDSEFGKGATAYDLRMGDERHGPNPCVAPLERAPFYAIKVVVGDIGTYVGVSTDENSRVLDSAAAPVPGLYAAGNDVGSPFGGSDPAGGTMLGPAITSGYMAGCHLAGIDPRSASEGQMTRILRSTMGGAELPLHYGSML